MNILLLLSLLCGLAYSKSAVLIGDSISCGSFGTQLSHNLSKKYDSVTLYCCVSSAPTHWLRGVNPKNQKCMKLANGATELSPCDGQAKIPTIDVLLARHPDSAFIVALGTNSLLDSKPDPSYSQLSQRVAQEGDCTWIGPPHMDPTRSRGFPAGRVATLEKNLTEFYRFLGIDLEGSCSLVDSRPMTKAGSSGFATVDGVHRTDAAGRAWADALPTF